MAKRSNNTLLVMLSVLALAAAGVITFSCQGKPERPKAIPYVEPPEDEEVAQPTETTTSQRPDLPATTRDRRPEGSDDSGPSTQPKKKPVKPPKAGAG